MCPQNQMLSALTSLVHFDVWFYPVYLLVFQVIHSLLLLLFLMQMALLIDYVFLIPFLDYFFTCLLLILFIQFSSNCTVCYLASGSTDY